MPQSLAAIYVHIVFSTKDRRPFFADKPLRAEMHRYMAEVSLRLGGPVVEIGGVEDHVHILARHSRTMTLSDSIKEIKRVTNQWAKERVPDFAWQRGYGAFSVGAKELPSIQAYICGQETHHAKISFQDELRGILNEYGLEWNEEFLWE